MDNQKNQEILNGTTLKVYSFMVKKNKPLGIREIQKALSLSSPSLVQYHLDKLERAGYVKKNLGKYVILKFYLKNFFRINHYLVPRFAVYLLISVLILFSQIIFLERDILFLAILPNILIILIFCFEYLRNR